MAIRRSGNPRRPGQRRNALRPSIRIGDFAVREAVELRDRGAERLGRQAARGGELLQAVGRRRDVGPHAAVVRDVGVGDFRRRRDEMWPAAVTRAYLLEKQRGFRDNNKD